jgi:FkbM family methyltransferase
MISYAQQGEDVLLSRLFPADYVGFYVDIGANDPVGFSITKHFYDHGWTGVNVEPAALFERLREHRPRDINLNVAISQSPGRATLFDYPTAPCNATLSSVVAKDNERFPYACVRREVEVITLKQLCEQYVKGRTIDFMSIDVENHEAEVVAGGDWNRFRPRVLVVEATFPHSSEPSHTAWEPVLLNHDYRFAIFDGLNRFYVREEDAHLLQHLQTPANSLDQYVPHFYQALLEQHQALLKEHQAMLESPWQLLEYLSTRTNSVALRAGLKVSRLLHKTATIMPSPVRRSWRMLRSLGVRPNGHPGNGVQRAA